jgi:protoporphyrin/coproporphyrin ferrochelatase
MRELGKSGDRAAVIVPIGFLCDHVEVLYDLDIEAAQIARESGVTMVRAATVSDHPQFIELMATLVRAHLLPSLIRR